METIYKENLSEIVDVYKILGMLEKIEKFLNKFQNKYNTQIEL